MTKRMWACAVVLAFGVSVLGSMPVAAQQKIPADFSFEKSKDSPGTVTFSHEKHKASGVDKCTACHTKVFKMKKGATPASTMEQMKAGQACGTCHNGKTEINGKKVFTVDDKGNCEKCHRK